MACKSGCEKLQSEVKIYLLSKEGLCLEDALECAFYPQCDSLQS